MFKNLNPLKILIYWLIFCIIITVGGMILLGVATTGGEQKPLLFLVFMLKVTVYSIFIISILSIPFYLQWVRKYWYVNLCFLALSSWIIFLSWMGDRENQFLENQKGSITTNEIVNGKTYKKTVVYYEGKFEHIKSVSFRLQNKKDSIWTTYSDDGRILTQEQYMNDSLIKIIK